MSFKMINYLFQNNYIKLINKYNISKMSYKIIIVLFKSIAFLHYTPLTALAIVTTAVAPVTLLINL